MSDSGSNTKSIFRDDNETSDLIIENRLSKNTRKQYESKIKIFKSWLADRYPHILDQQTLRVDLLTVEIIKHFLGHICKKKNNNSKIQY